MYRRDPAGHYQYSNRSDESSPRLVSWETSHMSSSRSWLGRSGNWRKRLLLLTLCIVAWATTRNIADSLLADHTEFYDELRALVVNSNLAGRNSSIYSEQASSVATSDVAKITMAYGDLGKEYTRALNRQLLHSSMHNYETKILRSKLLGRLYTKPAFVLSTILQELEKPEDEQLKWLFWFDLDMVIMNPNIPLETYLPREEIPDLHMLVTDDHNGLNTGAFFVRIHPWSAQLFADAIAMPSLHPEIPLKYSEQSALEILLKETRNQGKAAWLPQRWINAYMGHRDGKGDITKVTPEGAKRGDLLIHFAGKKTTKDRMALYLDIAEGRDPTWELPLETTGLLEETERFWREYAEARRGEAGGQSGGFDRRAEGGRNVRGGEVGLANVRRKL